MYVYNAFDQRFVAERAAQFRDQLDRFFAGTLGGDEFKPLRLQNGWYIQRFAPMLRVAVPYGELSSAQLRVLAKIARDYDHKEDHDTSQANAGLSEVPTLPDRCAACRSSRIRNTRPLHRPHLALDCLGERVFHPRIARERPVARLERSGKRKPQSAHVVENDGGETMILRSVSPLTA